MSDASRGHHDSCGTPQNWRRDELVARILRRWRTLTGDKNTSDQGRRTLIACSAGSDSVALAFALSQVPGSCVIAHIQHDIRSEQETQADADHVRSLATAWNVPFVSEQVAVRDMPHNLEANARHARYGQLVNLAKSQNCRFIATGHHADDQLETVMMHMMRGSGLRGMAGMRAITELNGIHLVRPLLGITHSELEELLQRAGVTWREDATNQDHNLLRNRIRHELLPSLRAFEPEIAIRASQWAGDLRAVHHFMSEQLDLLIDEGELCERGVVWNRQLLRATPDILLGQLPHRLCERFSEHVGQDSIKRRVIEDWVRSLKSDVTDPSVHRIGPIVSILDAHTVRMESAAGGEYGR